MRGPNSEREKSAKLKKQCFYANIHAKPKSIFEDNGEAMHHGEEKVGQLTKILA